MNNSKKDDNTIDQNINIKLNINSEVINNNIKINKECDINDKAIELNSNDSVKTNYAIYKQMMADKDRIIEELKAELAKTRSPQEFKIDIKSSMKKPSGNMSNLCSERTSQHISLINKALNEDGSHTNYFAEELKGGGKINTTYSNYFRKSNVINSSIAKNSFIASEKEKTVLSAGKRADSVVSCKFSF